MDRVDAALDLLGAELLIWLVFLDDIELEEKLGRREREGVCLVTLLLELGGVVDLLGVTDRPENLDALELEDLCGAGLDCGADLVVDRLLDELLEACGLL